MSYGRHLRRFTEQHGAQKTGAYLVEAIKVGKVSKSKLSIRDLAESYMGPQWDYVLTRYKAGVREASEAVDPSTFVNITGQLLINEIHERYESPEFIGMSLVQKVPVTNGNLGPQKTPWLGSIVDAPSKIQPGQQYPYTTFGEQYITYPAPEKYGEICAVTMEAIFADLTTQIMEAAQAVGKRTAEWQEEQILKVITGVTNNHSWNGTDYSTYQASTPWINTKSGVSLVDWNEINEAEQLLAEMRDPVTSKPIRVVPNAIMVMPRKKYNAKRAMAATNTRSGTPGSGTSGNVIEAPNPLDLQYPVVSSQYAYQVVVDSGVSAANAKEWWFLGDFKKAFVWREVAPLRVVEAPPQNPMEFHQDVALAVKANLFGVAAVRDPRYVVKIYNS